VICGHCNKEPTADWASYNGVRVCNPESGLGQMECYRLIRDFHHDFDCIPCQVMGGSGVTEIISHEH
jgi:hypothetical protein